MSRKFRVLLHRAPEPDPQGEREPEVIEFIFAAPAKEYAQTEVEEGRARKAVVLDPDGTVIRTFPR